MGRPSPQKSQAPPEPAAPAARPPLEPLPRAEPTLWDRLFPSPSCHPDIIRLGWIQGNQLHNFLLLLYHLARVPLPLWALLLAPLVWGTASLFAWPGAALLALGLPALGDLVLLLALPRLGVSFGWPQPPWLLYTLGRCALALPLALLPLEPLPAVALLAGVQATLSALSLYGSLVEPFALQDTELELPLPGLRAPLSALLITDLHMERWTRRERELLRRAERRRPDVVLIGGDLLNLSYVGDPTAMAHCRELLSALRAPGGVYFVRGTRDVDAPQVMERMLRGLPLRRLENEAVEVRHGGAAFTLVGVPAVDTPEEREARQARLCEGQAPPLVCLHHTPDLVEAAARAGADLYLAGHTHGGQICLPLLGPLATASRFGRRYVRGFHTLGQTRAYVSRGVGLEGLGAPRMRFLARPELVWLQLKPAPPLNETGAGNV